MMKIFLSSNKIFLFCLAWVCCFSIAQGQSKTIDSLKNRLPHITTDTSRAMLLNDIAWEYIMTGGYEEALTYSLQALDISKTNPRQRGATGALNNLGTIYVILSDYAKALGYFNESLKLTEKYHDEIGRAGLYNNIGIIYNHLKDFKTAISFHKKSITLHKKLNSMKGIAQCQVNLSSLYIQEKKFPRAIEVADSALKFYEDEKNYRDVSLCLSNIGSAYLSMKEPDKALPYFNRSLAINIEENNRREISVSYYNLGGFYQATGKLDQAIENYKKSYEVAKALKSLDQQQSSVKGLYEAYKLKGDYKQSVVYLEISGALRDSIFSSEKNESLNNTKIKFALDRQENELKAQSRAENDRLKLIAKQENEKQQLIIYSVMAGLLLVLIFAVFIFNRFKVTQKQKKLIEVKEKETQMQKHLVEEKNKEITDSINYAKRIQYALLAHDELMKKNLPDHFVLFKPKDIVSGDFYWATKTVNSTRYPVPGTEQHDMSTVKQPGTGYRIPGAFYLAVCDSTGHGVPGAFMSLLNISFLNEGINEKSIDEPSLVLDHVRERLIKNISQDGAQDGMDGILVKFENTNTTVEISYAAAHNSPVLVRNGQVIEYGHDKMPVGFGGSSQPFNLFKIDAQKGDLLYLFTDGFADQFGGPKGKKFKYAKLQELLLNISNLPLERQKQELNHHFEAWRGDLEQVDDVCVIGIRI